MKHELLSELGQYLIEGSLSDVRVLKKTGHEPPLRYIGELHGLMAPSSLSAGCNAKTIAWP